MLVSLLSGFAWGLGGAGICAFVVSVFSSVRYIGDEY